MLSQIWERCSYYRGILVGKYRALYVPEDGEGHSTNKTRHTNLLTIAALTVIALSLFYLLMSRETDINTTTIIPVTDQNDKYNYQAFHSLDENLQWLEDTLERFPKFTTRVNFGKSYQGRPIVGLKISANITTKSSKVLFINTGMHAREWAGPSQMINLVQEILTLLEESSSSSRYHFKTLLSEIDLIALPHMNPDGYQYSWTTDRVWRRTRSDNKPVIEQIGVDPSRNFPVVWDRSDIDPYTDPNESSRFDPNNYRGPSPASENCVEAFIDYFKNEIIKSYQDIAYIDVHCCAQSIFYPFGYQANDQITDEKNQRNFQVLEKISKKMADAAEKSSKKFFSHGPTYQIYGPVTGTSMDYVYDKLKVTCVFTIEMRTPETYDETDHTYTRFVFEAREIPEYSAEMLAMYRVLLAHVRDGDCAV